MFNSPVLQWWTHKFLSSRHKPLSKGLFLTPSLLRAILQPRISFSTRTMSQFRLNTTLTTPIHLPPIQPQPQPQPLAPAPEPARKRKGTEKTGGKSRKRKKQDTSSAPTTSSETIAATPATPAPIVSEATTESVVTAEVCGVGPSTAPLTSATLASVDEGKFPCIQAPSFMLFISCSPESYPEPTRRTTKADATDVWYFLRVLSSHKEPTIKPTNEPILTKNPGKVIVGCKLCT